VIGSLPNRDLTVPHDHDRRDRLAGMTNVLMADSTRPWLIPPSIKYAMAYGDGPYEWTTDQKARFEGHIQISTDPSDLSAPFNCRACDVEDGAYQVAHVPHFLRQRETVAPNGTVYCSRDLIDPIYTVCKAQGVRIRRWIIATLDGTRIIEVPEGILWGAQYHEERHGDYDLSVVYGPYDWTRKP
jgi:hypothetical protein